MIYMHYLNVKCHPGHPHNAFMLTGVFGHIHVQLRVVLVVAFALTPLSR